MRPIEFTDQYYDDREEDFVHGKDDEDWLWEDEELCDNDEEYQWEYFNSNDDTNDVNDKEEIVVDESVGAEVLNEDDKLFIFTTGVKTFAPHQIGVKLMSKIKFKKKLNIPKDIAAFFKEHEEERQRVREQLEGRVAVEVTPWHDYKVKWQYAFRYSQQCILSENTELINFNLKLQKVGIVILRSFAINVIYMYVFFLAGCCSDV